MSSFKGEIEKGKMYVIKRGGIREKVHFDKITSRITKLCYGLDTNFVEPVLISQKVISGFYSGITTSELDQLSAETAASLATKHPDYSILASRICISNLHKETKKDFSNVVDILYNNYDDHKKKKVPLLSQQLYDVVQKYKQELNSAIIYDRDYKYDYFGFKTLENKYLLRIGNKIIERPQHMLMRVAIGIHGDNLGEILDTYELMSLHYFIHATPTLYNAGTINPQLSSCFLLSMKDDSIEGIYDTLKDSAVISKYSGGIGISITNIRATNSYIYGTNGVSNGICPMIRVFNNSARYVDQGGGKRKGSIAFYLEPWHADVFEFLELKKNHGNENERARDLFFALWVPDLFMKRVKEDGNWSLFCPNEIKNDEDPALYDVYGEEFERLYIKYENRGLARKTIKASDLWLAILRSQSETGNPYMCYKDSCNKKSNQKNLGTIRSSNLCTEIMEFSSKDEIAVCNLASINLTSFVTETLSYDFQKLYEVSKRVTRNLNRVIDVNFYPLPEAKLSNMRNRPIGIGVQGLADTFIKMRYPFESQEASELNKKIFETIYFAAMETSCEIAKQDGFYETYPDSPVSQGIFQFDMWNVTPSDMWDWQTLKEEVSKYGIRNSLLMAPMPTASTSQILGNTESIEAINSNIYTRRVLSGEFIVVNKYLIKDLISLGLWSENMKNEIVSNRGSIEKIREIPEELRNIYKTVWEIKQKAIIDQAADRGPYICQSQSLNIHLAEPTVGKLSSMHFYGWEKGLKTGMYYLRSLPRANPIQVTVNKKKFECNGDETCDLCSA